MYSQAPPLAECDTEEVYQKKLTESDMKESSRLYIMKAARRICPPAFEQTFFFFFFFFLSLIIKSMMFHSVTLA
jgi:hypothetical protein